MEFSFSLNIRASKEDVWAYYENIEKWYDWEEDLKNITLKVDLRRVHTELWNSKECPLWNISSHL